MNLKNKIFISVPYVYPLCPLNFNHAKMFVIADVLARYSSTQCDTTEVIFPIASHFTGNTAQSTANHLYNFFSDNKNEENTRVFQLHKNQYNTPINILKQFVDPHYLMSYYNQEILWELKSLNVSCDYKNAYTTECEEFSSFVKSIIKQYEVEGLLVLNRNNDIAINYNDTEWRKETIKSIAEADIQQPFQRNILFAAFENLSSDWELLRNSGFGVQYKNGLIIDPMFDSELFMIFDLYIRWKNQSNLYIKNIDLFFDHLIEALKEKKILTDNLSFEEKNAIEYISNYLPCDIFVGEEHLKNWIGKKFFAEQRLLHPTFRTKKYQILGMGMLDGKRMSASRGHAIFSRNLIKEYGGQIARLVLLLSGGNISKNYNYEIHLPQFAKKIFDDFSDYWIFLNSNYVCGHQNNDVVEYSNIIERNILDGYFRQAIIELFINIPNRNKHPNFATKEKLLKMYNKYLKIFLPEYAKCHN